MTAALYSLQSVRYCRAAAGEVVREVSLSVAPGEFVALCGLNGAGKSTLLKIMAGLLAGYGGACKFDDRELARWNPRELARSVSFLPQSAEPAARFTGIEVVRMGRYPFGAGWGESEKDVRICADAMHLAGCEELRDRFVNQLSGGERQRVLFAAVLAQQPRVLLLDEPGTFVDLPHQIQMFRTLRQLCLEQNLACVTATHDLNLAASFCTRIVLLDRGRVVVDAPPAEALPGDAFRRVFGNHVRVEKSAEGSVRVHYEI